MTMTPEQAIQKLTLALGRLLTVFEDHVNEELTPQELQVFDEAAELYAQMSSLADVQAPAPMKKRPRWAS